MTFYLDTSILVPLFVPESSSDAVQNWFDAAGEPLAIGRLAVGEFGSAIFRRRRRNELDADSGDRALALFDAWITAPITIVEHLRADLIEAGRLVRRPTPKLLMPDSIHLATCRRLGLALVTNDDRLLPAADIA